MKPMPEWQTWFFRVVIGVNLFGALVGIAYILFGAFAFCVVFLGKDLDGSAMALALLVGGLIGSAYFAGQVLLVKTVLDIRKAATKKPKPPVTFKELIRN